MSLDIATEPHGPVTVIVRLSGQFDYSHVATARTAINELLAGGARYIVINLDGLEYIDSAGLGVIVGTLARLRDHQGEVGIVCATPRVRRVLEITRLTQLFTIHDTEASALSHTPPRIS